MESILKLHSLSVLNTHYKNGTLQYLDKIGKKRSEIIIDYFENEYNESDILCEIKFKYDVEEDLKNIGEYDYDRIYESFNWLENLNLNDFSKEKLMKKFIYKILTPIEIENEPMLLKEIDQTLKKIDEIALSNKWWNEDSIQRHDHYIEYIINKLCEKEGHTFITRGDINTYNESEFLNLNERIIRIQLKRLVNDGILVNYGNKYFLKEIYDKEKTIIDIVNEFKNITYNVDNLEIDDFEKDDNGNELTDEQITAINGIRNNLISILKGPGGSGKTNKVIKNICDYEFNKFSGDAIFLAPTHAAKKNGKKAVGETDEIKYETIHSITSPFKLNRNNTPDYDYDEYDSYNDNEKTNNLENYLNEGTYKYIFIDEMSMVDLNLFFNLLNTCYNYYNSDNYNNELHIVLIGDENQLSPIGIGEPFINLINIVPTYTLTKNFRSNEDIKNHCNIILNKDSHYKEYWTFKEKNKYSITNKFKNVKCLFSDNWKEDFKKILIKLKKENRIPSTNNGKDVDKSFQCISFTNNICEEVCPIIRNIFNNDKSNDIYKKGDYIVIKKNVRGKFNNNDMGQILDIEGNYYKIRLDEPFNNDIEFEKKKEFYDKNNGNNKIYLEKRNIIYVSDNYFKPNYCRTVHSSQGLQYPIVIYILDKYYKGCNIKLNYTASSRAQNKLYLIGDRKAFRNTNIANKKNTLLSRINKEKHNTDKIINNITEKYTEISQNISINKRKKIPKKLRYDLWTKYFDSNMKGKCYVCNTDIEFIDFHCGHIKSVCDGGDNNINNLKPICPPCNYAMGIKNLEEYKKNHYS